jgi:hypothetical protein
MWPALQSAYRLLTTRQCYSYLMSLNSRNLLILMARETGLEPATSGVTGRRSNQLSYSPATRRRSGRTGGLPDRIGQKPRQAQH